MLLEIFKRKCDKVVCKVFGKKTVMFGDVVSGIFNTTFTIGLMLTLCLFVGMIAFALYVSILPIPEAISDGIFAMNTLGLIVFGTLFGAFVIAATLLIYQLSSKAISLTIRTCKRISQFKVAENPKNR